MKNWKLTVSVGIVAVAATVALAEPKHAPTLESCIADVNLWSSQIPGFPDATLDQVRSGTKGLTMHEISVRVSSISDCVAAYPMIGQGQKGSLSAATTLIMFYDYELKIRYSNFLVRHNMLDTFNDEDQAGVR
ncbi:MAG TPA: hypothetical protein VEI52_15990 [Terriglobales bacterium]|nr:hypothetical protein [Terriglobales bacterium]